MIKSLKAAIQQEREKYRVPRRVQDLIPIQRIWNDGIFQSGGKFSKTYKFTDINYLVASREDKESMFLTYRYANQQFYGGNVHHAEIPPVRHAKEEQSSSF